jgi:ion channel-forming bestrophin family protein
MLLNKKIPAGYILQKVWPDVLYTGIIGVIVYYLTHKVIENLPSMPIAIPAFLGTAISIILSFKLNQSYDRWWEARKIWGAIVNDSRNLVLQLQSFISNNDDDIRKMTFRQIGWCYSLGQTLRNLNAVENLDKFLTKEEIDKVSEHANKPLAILQLNAQHIAVLKQSDKLDTFSHIQLNNTIVNLVNSMGMAERIKLTVFPATYKLFLHLFIYLFVITLSISLMDVEIYFEVPLLLIISSVFFLLERTATHLQDPFSNKPTDTAMTAIATNIEINLKQLIGEKEVPQPVSTDKFYLL